MLALILFFVGFGHAGNINQDIPSFHVVSTQGIYRGGRPGTAGLFDLHMQLGVKTEINLDDDKESNAQELAAAKAYGMRVISLPMSGFWTPHDKTVNAALAALNDPKNYPIYIHCQYGHDRTGLVVGLFRVQHDGWTAQKAYGEMLVDGFHPALVFLDHYYREKTGL